MKSVYNSEEHCRVSTCSICGYTYHEYYNENRLTNKEKPFIEAMDGITVSIPRDYAPDKILKLTRYICPECGCVQIDTSDLD